MDGAKDFDKVFFFEIEKDTNPTYLGKTLGPKAKMETANWKMASWGNR